LPRVGPHNNQKNENEKLAHVKAKKKEERREEIGIKPSKKNSNCITQARARDLNQKRDRRYTDTQQRRRTPTATVFKEQHANII
jgi:hypothetical protein